VYTNKVHITNCFAVPYDPAEEQVTFFFFIVRANLSLIYRNIGPSTIFLAEPALMKCFWELLSPGLAS
jgi:hypothetical protein